MQIQPYLFFDGRCEEAIEFYKSALGATVEMKMRFSDAPKGGPQSSDCAGPPPQMDKVMHAQIRIGDTVIMASDGECKGKANFQGFALSVNAADEAEADRVFAALSNGGKVQMPMTATF